MVLKAAMWVHGTIVEVEYPEQLYPMWYGGMRRSGWGTHFWGKENTKNWFHIPITTPVILDDTRPKLKTVFVFYKTQSGTKITNVHIWDGPNQVKAFDNLALSGDHSAGIDDSNTWKLEEPITLYYGLGISVGVEFGAPWSEYEGGRPFPAPEVLFTTAGADFVG